MEAAQLAVGILAVVEQAAAAEGASAAAGDEDGQLAGIVGVAVEEAGAEDDHAVVEKGAFAFLGVLHFGEGAGEDLHVVFVGLLVHGQTGGIIGVMREFVQGALDAAPVTEVHAGEVVVEHQRGHSGSVHLEGEHEQVEHQIHVILGMGRQASGGSREGGVADGGQPTLSAGFLLTKFLGLFDALFEFADGGQVLVHFEQVALAEVFFEALRLCLNQVEHGAVALAFAAVVEELVEGLLGVDFLWRWRGGGAP